MAAKPGEQTNVVKEQEGILSAEKLYPGIQLCVLPDLSSFHAPELRGRNILVCTSNGLSFDRPTGMHQFPARGSS